MRGLEQSCAETVGQEQLAPAEKYEAFFAVLKRDAESAVAAVELVLAQPAISSQLIDNLNASIHLRALLADCFLVTEISGRSEPDAGRSLQRRAERKFAVRVRQIGDRPRRMYSRRFSIILSTRATRGRLPMRTRPRGSRIRPAATFSS